MAVPVPASTQAPVPMRQTPKGPLRVVIVTEDDPLYVAEFFKVFFGELPAREIEVCAITVARAFHEPLPRTAQRMWRFYGPLDFARLATRFLRSKVRGGSIEQIAAARGIRVLRTDSVNAPAYVARVRALQPDVIVSVAAPEIFRADILSAATQGCINVHSGRLPKYRGMMPTFWQLLNGERHVTVTIHEMVPRLDAGAILATTEFPVRERDSLDRVMRETKWTAARLMISTLRAMADGRATSQPLDMSASSYFRFPTTTDVRAFRARGHTLL